MPFTWQKTTVNGDGERNTMIYEVGVIIIFMLSMLIPDAIYVFIALRKNRMSNGKYINQSKTQSIYPY